MSSPSILSKNIEDKSPTTVTASPPLPTSTTRRSKTFTGCFTCRSRKIKCDLTKPQCEKCTRAGLICAGYDIKLRWSDPIQYIPTKTGNVKSQPIKFPNKDDEQLDENSNNNNNNNNSSSEFFQRRQVGFVKWDEPYETYEDMDLDLSILHGSGEDPIVKLLGETKLKGPFGVFKGEPPLRHKVISQESPLKFKKRKLNNSHNNSNSNSNSNSNVTVGDVTSNRSNTYSNVSSPSVNGHSFVTPASNLQPHAYNLESGMTHSDQPQDSQWISNELKDAALVTAAALDTQFLDLMFNFNNNVPTEDTGNTGNINTATTSTHTDTHNNSNNNNNNNNNNTHGTTLVDEFNNPDFLNLLFHKNLQLVITTPQPQVDTTPQLSHSNSNISLANILNQGSNTNNNDSIMNPTYYSNFSNFFYNNPYQSNENLEIDLHAKSTDHDDDEEEEEHDVDDHSNDSKLLQFIMKIVKNPTNLPFDLSLPSNHQQHQISIPINALQVQPLTRYLLNYYVTNVADLMTVIPLTESPWKTIYFPRALMALGELLALGKTSTAKNALLNALLAVLAFNLQSKFPKNSEPMRFYLNLGIALRNQASLFIKQLLHNNRNGHNHHRNNGIEYCINHEKYKDVLCAVLSMISVDLVWGTMQDTRIYITWCGKVIIAKMQNKKKLSTKASILHRIFLNLKLIQDSTCLDIDSINEDFETNYGIGIGYDVSGDKYVSHQKNDNNQDDNHGDDNHDDDDDDDDDDMVVDHNKVRKTRIDFIVNNTFTNKKQTSSFSSSSSSTTTTTTTSSSSLSTSKLKSSNTTSPSFVNKKLINTMKNDESFATDALYGLPYSLIVLFSETVELLRTKIYYRDNPKAAAKIATKLTHQEDFNNRIEDLNKKLKNWTLDWQLYEHQNKKTPTNNNDNDNDNNNDNSSEPQHEFSSENGQIIDNDKHEFDHKFYSPMHKATYHHIMSFYHGLVIYFNRLIKQISAINLQNHVRKTLQHLNAIQKLIDDKEANIIPLFWQGFIAGCEAISLDLQLAFKQWGADIAKYLGSYWGARQIMMEVWRRKRANEVRDDWISVIHDWEMNLMLA